jgi:hypothetical protein
MAEYPPYVEDRGGDPSWQPFACNNTQMYGFFIAADPAAIQNLLDRCLNAPTGGACEYRALSSHVLVTFADSKHLAPTTAPVQGWVPERSASIWVFAAAVTRELGVYVAKRLVTFPAYVFVDIGWSLVTGREVFGFPKQDGPIELPPWKDPAERMSATTMVLRVFDEQEAAREEVVLAVDRLGDGSASAEVWTTLEDAGRFILQRFDEGARVILPGLGFLKNLVELALHRDVPGVFLKQFRDVADGTRACYQAITEAPMQVTGLHEGGVLSGSFQVTTVDYASCRIMRDLGLQTTTVPVTAAFYLDFDFIAQPGREVWKA